MKKIKQLKSLFTPKNLPRLIILVIILGALFYVYDKFLKEGFETQSGDLDEQVKSGTKLVLFYADWCGHCKKIKPVWDETAKEVNADEVKMIKVFDSSPLSSSCFKTRPNSLSNCSIKPM